MSTPKPKLPREGKGKHRAPPPPPAPGHEAPFDEPDEHPLSPVEAVYVREYLVHQISVRAYRVACPQSSPTSALRNARVMHARPWVRAAIRAGLAEQSRRARLDADRAVRLAVAIAEADPLDLTDPRSGALRPLRDIPSATRRAIQSVRVIRTRTAVTRSGRTRTTTTESVVEYRFEPRGKALSLLFGTLGLSEPIPPLERVLQLLPPDVASEVRAALAKPPAKG